MGVLAKWSKLERLLYFSILKRDISRPFNGKRVFEKEDNFMKAKTFLKQVGTTVGVITALGIFEAVQIGMIKELFDENEELHKVNREIHDNNIILKTKLGLKELDTEDIKNELEKFEEDVEESENDISEHDEAES